MSPPDHDNVCLRCGYSLEGLPDMHRCPECGLPFGSDAPVWRLMEPSLCISWTRLRVFVAWVVILAVVLSIVVGPKQALAGLGGVALWQIALHVFVRLAAKSAEKRLRIEMVSIEPEGLVLRYGSGKWEAIPWSAISRVSTSLLRATAHVWRRDTATVFDLATYFRDRSDARRFADLANKHIAAAAQTGVAASTAPSQS